MRLLNDHKGNLDGRVQLTKYEASLLHSALFYMIHEEPHADKKAILRTLQSQFHTLEKVLPDEDE